MVHKGYINLIPGDLAVKLAEIYRLLDTHDYFLERHIFKDADMIALYSLATPGNPHDLKAISKIFDSRDDWFSTIQKGALDQIGKVLPELKAFHNSNQLEPSSFISRLNTKILNYLARV